MDILRSVPLFVAGADWLVTVVGRAVSDSIATHRESVAIIDRPVTSSSEPPMSLLEVLMKSFSQN